MVNIKQVRTLVKNGLITPEQADDLWGSQAWRRHPRPSSPEVESYVHATVETPDGRGRVVFVWTWYCGTDDPRTLVVNVDGEIKHYYADDVQFKRACT